MSESKNHTKVYSEADIRRYLSGHMSATEMHALENAALDDPFLADAIEGMEEADATHSPALVSEHLSEARKQLQERISEKKPGTVFPLFWMRTAVAAALILLAGTWIYYTISKNDDQPAESIAKQEPDKNIKPSESAAYNDSVKMDVKVPVASADSTTWSDTEFAKTKKVPAPVAESTTKETQSLQDKAIESKPVNAPAGRTEARETTTTAPLKKSEAVTKSSQSKIDDEKELRSSEADKLEDNAGVSRRKEAPAKADNFNNKLRDYINIKVVDTNNIPIPNASISLTNQKKNYLTDQNGILLLPSSDTIVNATIASVGYKTQAFQFRSDLEINKIQLNAASNLSDVVVVGYGAQEQKRKEKTNYSNRAPKVMVQDAEPTIGWLDYNKYIDSAKATVPAPISGDVVISFLVNKAGEKSSFKIEQSVSTQQDEASLRIVKAGSAWRLLKGKKQRVYVIIKY